MKLPFTRRHCSNPRGRRQQRGGFAAPQDLKWGAGAVDGFHLPYLAVRAMIRHDTGPMSRDVIIAGIDEAGYGPILGPLVVSATAWRIAARDASDSLWDILRRSVSPSPSVRDARVPIVDSKRLFKQKAGLGRLERSVLGVVGTWRGIPPTLAALLRLVAPEAIDRLRGYPWYGASERPLPVSADRGAVRIAASLLGADMKAHGIRSAGFWSEVLPEAHYNRRVAATRNKAVVLLGLTMRLIQRVAQIWPDHELRIFIDKQGARDHYGAVLMRSFADRRLHVVLEGHDQSVYELTGGAAAWQIGFRQSGESQHLPVAMASMVSKYLREVLMGCFNAYWSEQVPGLRPTAGYYQDGQRFLRDVAPHLRRLGIVRDQLVRTR